MPTAVSLLQRLHQHRAWANEKLVEAAAMLSPEELRQPQTIGQGSVWQSLLHMYAAEYLHSPSPNLPLSFLSPWQFAFH